MLALTNKDVLTAFIKSTSGEFEILDILRKRFEEKGLYEKTTSKMGGSAKEIISRGISNIESIPNKNIVKAVDSSIDGLNEIYQSKNSKLNQIYWLCVITIAASIILIGLGLILIFTKEVGDESRLGILTTASSIVPTLIGGTAFILYDKIKKGTEGIENEIVKLKKLNVFFNMIENIPSPAAKEKAYNEIIKQMV